MAEQAAEQKAADQKAAEQKAAEQKQHEKQEQMLKQIAKELNLPLGKVRTTVGLLDDGNTIPFIARYRKEMTGEMDEEVLRGLDERLGYLRNLDVRKEEVLRIIEEQGKLTEELRQSIAGAVKLQEVEDLYRPYRQKRKTRASVAKEKGLEPLSEWLLSEPVESDPLEEAKKYVNAELEVHSAEDALQGAMDIVAEHISDDASIRAWVRRFSWDHGIVRTEAKDKEQQTVYEMYYEYSEPVKKLPPHRILAINRGERENVLKVTLELPASQIHAHISKSLMKRSRSAVRSVLEAVIEDAYKRLLAPSIERDIRGELTEKAEEHAIEIFAQNLDQLLMQPPVRGKQVLGVDPAYRTGCKLAVVDHTGKLEEVAVIYPTPPLSKVEAAAKTVKGFIEKYGITLIVIGNGTASRETEQFIADVITELPERELAYLIVSEAGASVYSASELARKEFPELDVAERSAISIARRLQDPLAELVKIEPKAIGVGQYQHDVTQKRLDESLKAVVESAVNRVGVDLNTASPSLLSYISGVNKTIAGNIVKYREENGIFTDRKQLKKVPRLGAKAFEQCAGFLRIQDGANPIDNTPIHPESYDDVDRLFQLLGRSADDLGSEALKSELQASDVSSLSDRLEVGVPTLRDIVDSLQRPGRDPRDELPKPIFRTDVLRMEDLKPGMELMGTVRNVIDFGAFVDIGVKQDGLVHISQLSDRYVKHPLDVVAIGDNVTVWVLRVDVERGRISLTMKGPQEA